MSRPQKAVAAFGAIVVVLALWIYSNRPTQDDLATYAPEDALAYVEVNDLAAVAAGLTQNRAWRSLAAPLGAPANIAPNRTFLWLARWTGIGSAEAIVLARSQISVVFTGAEGSETGSTLTIKPLFTFVIETHSSERRVRGVLERHLSDLAQRTYGSPVFIQKQIGGADLRGWQSPDRTRQIVFTFVGSALIVSNDESSILRALEVRAGKSRSLRDKTEFRTARQSSNAAADLFGYVSQPGVKSFLQGYALSQASASSEAIMAARIFADTLGGLVSSITWRAKFTGGLVEDQCAIALLPDVSEKLRPAMSPSEGTDVTKLPFAPSDVYSVSLYHFRDTAGFWADLNAAVSAHSDLVGAMAARPLLQSLIKQYGIDDVDMFVRAVGPRLQTIRLEKDSSAVLIAEAFDRPAIQKAIAKRFAAPARWEKVGETDLLLSTTGDWGATFVNNYFLIGPADNVRRCVQANAQSRSLSQDSVFRQSLADVDVSLPLISVSFTSDRAAAVSFVEVFGAENRASFASNASAIDAAVKSLPYQVSISILRGQTLEWTSRSAFGIGGSLLVQLTPQRIR